MTASTMNIRINNIINSVSNSFNETDFELNVYRIRQVFAAYGTD